MIVLSVVLNFLQSYRSQQAVRRLQEKVAGTAAVRRDGQWCELPRHNVVPGDVVRLGAGDMVPADARLLASPHYSQITRLVASSNEIGVLDGWRMQLRAIS